MAFFSGNVCFVTGFGYGVVGWWSLMDVHCLLGVDCWMVGVVDVIR